MLFGCQGNMYITYWWKPASQHLECKVAWSPVVRTFDTTDILCNWQLRQHCLKVLCLDRSLLVNCNPAAHKSQALSCYHLRHLRSKELHI